MAVYKRDMVDINLETGNIHRSFLKHSIGYKDQQADHFGIRAYRNGEPVNLTGVSIQGIFMPPQGDPIAITSGNIVNYNEAEVVLPQACYNYNGQFTLAIKLVDPSNSVTGTMRIVDGMVDNTNASGTVAPVAAIPSYQEVLSTYEQAIAAINKTVRFDASQSLTDTQKATARTNIAAASAADLATETANREAADADLKSALTINKTTTAWSSGGINPANGSETSNSSRIRTNDKYGISTGTEGITALTGYEFSVFAWNASTNAYVGMLLTNGTFATTGTAKWTNDLSFARYPNYIFRIVLRNAVSTTESITTAEGSNGVFRVCRYKTDKTLIVSESPADAKATGDEFNYTKAEIQFISGKSAMRFEQKGIDPSTGNYYDSAIRCATMPMSLEQGTYMITATNENLNVMIYKGSSLLGGAYSAFIVNVESGQDIAVVIKDKDGANITPDDIQKTVYIEKYTPEELKDDDLNGVSLKCMGDELIANGSIFSVVQAQSKIWKMPKSGINVQMIITEDGGSGYIACCFYRKSNGLFVGATDYQYGNIKWSDGEPTFLLTRTSVYYPYDEDLYFSVIYSGYGDSVENSELENVYVSYGTVRNGNGCLTNLSPATIGYGTYPEPNTDITGAYPTFRLWNPAGYATQQYYYGSVIRLQDAKAICCSADLSLLCWAYDNDGVLLGKVLGSSLTDLIFSGKNYIDLSKFGTEGYAVVLVRSPYTAKQPESDATTTVLDEQTMGGIHLRDYVMNHVYVQYYNSVIITHETGLNPILARNIEQFKKMDCGATFAFQYGGPVTSSRLRMNKMEHAAPTFYAGSQFANALLQNVSVKSYVTAIQNKNSSVYYSDMNNGAVRAGYGMVCANLPPALYGIRWALNPGSWFIDDIEYPGFTIMRNFDFMTRYDEVKAGDWMVGHFQGEEDAHIVLITDIVYINGAIISYEGMEAFPPLVRYRSIFVDPVLERFNLEFARREPVGDFYRMLIKPDRALIQPIEEVFGSLATNYTVGKLMCDRGTDSVYCITNDKCEITIADDTVETIKVYKDGNLVTTYTVPADADRIHYTGHPYSAVDFLSVIKEYGSGYYTLKANNNDTVQESFYVAPAQTVRATATAEDEITMTFTNSDDVVFVNADYMPVDAVEWDRDLRMHVVYTSDMIKSGELVFPRYVNYTAKDSQGQEVTAQFVYDWAEVIYQSDYGTYVVRRCDQTDDPPFTIINSDGKFAGQEKIYDD